MSIQTFIIGLDFGSTSARGVLIDAASGEQIDACVAEYRHGTLTDGLESGVPLGKNWALQVPQDYLDATKIILASLGDGRRILSIGLGFTASSPMPTKADGTALASLYPDDPHAYVKLWKHRSAQKQADRISANGSGYLENFGGKVSGEWLLAKAAQIAEDAPESWARTQRFIEAGDWIVWQLTGSEARSLSFASYKAQYSSKNGYPKAIVPGLESRLTQPLRVGSKAGELTLEWRYATGIVGPTTISVAVIDSHVVLPAINAIRGGYFVGALGTSAAYLVLSDKPYPLPNGMEGVAYNGTLPDLWCYEAGQASFGDTLRWFAQTFPLGNSLEESFAAYGEQASEIGPGESGLLALDWWNGNRVPHSDADLSGLILGLGIRTKAVEIYRALVEALCYGTRSVLEVCLSGGLPIDQVMMTSGLAQRNPLLLQIMADVLGRELIVPDIDNATAVGAAIHGAVANGLVRDFEEGARRFGAKKHHSYTPVPGAAGIYNETFHQYAQISADATLQRAMKQLVEISNPARRADRSPRKTILSMDEKSGHGARHT